MHRGRIEAFVPWNTTQHSLRRTLELPSLVPLHSAWTLGLTSPKNPAKRPDPYEVQRLYFLLVQTLSNP